MRIIPMPEWFLEDIKFMNYAVTSYLDTYFSENKNEVLWDFSEAVYYSTRWWKRIRAVLALEFYMHFSWKTLEEITIDDDIVKVCVAIECLHSYSLVHDDLPCMDNDLYRRGELTTWNKYSEHDAILVWDLLNSFAFETLASLKDKKTWFELLAMFWRAVWFYWMVWGQVLDLFYEKPPSNITLEKLIETHNRKTWALITFSILSWIMLSWYKWELDKYVHFWQHVWLAFQVKDDILDKVWTFEETGKSVWNEQKWFVELIWIEKSEKYLKQLIKESLEIIDPLKSEHIEFLVRFISKRKR